MKTTFVLASLFAAAALASPLEKRDQKTVFEVVTKTVYKYNHGNTPQTTAAAPAATTAASDNNDQPAVVPTSTSSATDSQSTGTGSSASSGYEQNVLDAHNGRRSRHGVPDLVWSDTMASYAQQIGSSCVYAHNTGVGSGSYGQNIGAGAGPDSVPSMIETQMYDDEIGYYPGYGSEPSMSNFEHWGHFSQIVWKNTVSVGCATVYCPNGLSGVGSGVSPYFTVCNYSPPGNYGGEYAANVLKPTS